MAERRPKRSETPEHNIEYKATPSTPYNRTKPQKTRTGPSRPEHNADHKNEQTPDNRPKTQAKTGPSPNKNLPPFLTGETASGSQDKPKNNPESDHEPKGNQGRPRNTQGPKSNNQGPPPVRKNKTKKNQTQTQSQHQTQNMTLTYIIIMILIIGKISISQK